MVKCCLVVDHPRRDLAGLYKLAIFLAENYNWEVYLTPMNYQMEEFVRIKPDIVLLTGLRKTTEYILKFLKSRNVLIAAIETEGAVYFSKEQFASKFIPASEANKLFDLFFAWGIDTKDILVNHLGYDESKIVVSGTPKVDLTVKKGDSKKEYVLFNTNYQGLDGIDENITYYKKTFNFDYNQFYRGLNDLRTEMIQLAIYCSEHLNYKIKFRPHPFENQDVYKKAFKGSAVELSLTGTIYNDLEGAYCTIQNTCTTGIESILYNVPTFSSGYIDTGFRNELVESITEFFYSKEEMLSKIAYSIQQPGVPDMESKLSALSSYFHLLNAQATEIIGEKMYELVEHSKRTKTNYYWADSLNYTYYFPLSKWLYLLKIGKSIDKRTVWKNSNKSFLPEDFSHEGKKLTIASLEKMLSVKIHK